MKPVDEVAQDVLEGYSGENLEPSLEVPQQHHHPHQGTHNVCVCMALDSTTYTSTQF